MSAIANDWTPDSRPDLSSSEIAFRAMANIMEHFNERCSLSVEERKKRAEVYEARAIAAAQAAVEGSSPRRAELAGAYDVAAQIMKADRVW